MEYTITIKFTADRELTQDELDALEATVIAQVEEPVVDGGEQGYVDAEYTTSDVTIITE